MAAADEEGGQSDSKKDDPASHETSKQFSTIHQEIENQLVRQGASYENRVSAVLSGWEHLAGTVQGDVSEVQPLATFLYKWSLRLILQGEWPGLAQIVKTRLGVTLQRCSKVAILDPLCRTLIPLVSDPWGHPTLKAILSEAEVEDSEASKYISNESWEVVRVRVDTMVESRCEELAFRVLKICVRCIRLRSEGMEVPLYTDEDHNHFVDLYFVLLYKFQRKTFLDEVAQRTIQQPYLGDGGLHREYYDHVQEPIPVHHLTPWIHLLHDAFTLARNRIPSMEMVSSLEPPLAEKLKMASLR
ncbi:uncharacterized protein LOC119596200 [Penaeus monodon]|uniref:uncharacterized protein LOC119596200 n=1 Tax=Penaeus monodon TaxID=6687 RepID=UPI0018A6F364|nr:uncharacterized protein LOC119596200 [Penaeus monodon]